MIFVKAFLNSLKLPNKKAMFKLNRIGMDIVVIYLFILLVIVTIPALIEQLGVTEGLAGDLPFILKLIYFFMFYYLPLTLGVFLFVSVISYVGLGISKIMKRKLRYQIIWKLIAFTTTVPFLVYTIIAFIYPIDDSYLLFATIYSLVLLIIMILKFPKRRVRTK